MERCVTLLVVREERIKNTMKYYFVCTRWTTKIKILKSDNTIAGEDTEQLEFLYTADTSINWRAIRQYLVKLKLCMPYDTTILLLGRGPRENLRLVHMEIYNASTACIGKIEMPINKGKDK